MDNSSLLSPAGSYHSGEVEDYRSQDVGTLPVSISSFSSRHTDEGLELTWVTVSETHNLGFHVWGDKGDGLEQLNAELIPAQDGDPVTPRVYTLVLPGLMEGDVLDLAVTAIDYRGDEEIYGLFEAGAKYGKQVTPAPIPWQEVRQQAKLRGQLLAAERKRMASILSGGNSGTSPRYDYVDVRVTEPGLQEITWEMLNDAGMNLNGVAFEDIAVTLKGESVSRHVVNANPRRKGSALSAAGSTNERGLRFGPGGKIRFWGEAPSYPDALYVEHYVYRVSVEPLKALDAAQHYGSGGETIDWHVQWQRRNDDNNYNFVSPTSDPWYARALFDRRGDKYEIAVEIDNQALPDRPAQLKILLGGYTYYDVAPDHHARVEVNGQIVADVMFDGDIARMLDLEIPADVLTLGTNTIIVSAPGGTAAPADLFTVDTVEFGYPRALVAHGNRILVEAPEVGGMLYATGFSSTDAVAYAFDGQTLTLLKHQAGRDGSLSVTTLDTADAHYWLSAANRLVSPDVVGAGKRNSLLGGANSDFLIIAHSAFLPVSARERHPLNTYLAQRRDEGWKPRVFDITEIQAEYGHGMPLPQALTAFLREADRRFGYEHVLLVGGDSYDYLDRLGHGSISFIPTVYASTKQIEFTPSDALLADLDGDGLADKAIGRWPVRTQGDLEAIVTKTLDWTRIDNPESAIWVTDSEDGNSGSFTALSERMIAPLADAGWGEGNLNRVYFADVAQRPGASRADSARMDLFDQLEQGRALTGFVGHGSPSMWTLQGLLTPDDLKDLYNEGNPTLIGTLTCYTSYFVSPKSDTVAHRWMNGYRENAAGGRIESVPNGAVAIHGAATLSNYNENEVFAKAVQEHQLAGKTLGQATLLARREAQANRMTDSVINWTLLGDPTLMLSQ